MICHLNDSFLVGLGERKVSYATGPVQRTLLKWRALCVPIPWAHGFQTRPEIGQGVGGTPPAEFKGDRSELLRLLERFCEFCEAPKRHRVHPVFGVPREDEWLRWGCLHADHLLRLFSARPGPRMPLDCFRLPRGVE
jgi:hypothetical protein